MAESSRNQPVFDVLGIVGVGLIGGSLGLAAKKRGLVGTVLGIGRSAEKLDRARTLGAIDEYTTDLISGARDADCLAVCVPVLTIVPLIAQMAPHLKPSCIVTDVGSTKGLIAREAERVLAGRNPFVGGHPMAGAEEAGVDAAAADLFVGATYVLTESPRTDSAALERLVRFASALGAKVVTMLPEEHDRRVAMVSHLPHLLAAALTMASAEDASELAAGSFRDATRVASSPPNLWRDICESNTKAIIHAVGELQGVLADAKTALMSGDFDAVEALFAQAKAARDELADRKGWRGDD